MPPTARHLALASLVLASAAAPGAFAGDVHSLSANVALTSDYRFRGISQSNEDPAISGGFDYTYNPLGLYLGTWASSIEFNGCTAPCTDPASLELDLYGGVSGELANGLGWNAGGIYYAYPSQNEAGASQFDYGEVYGKLSYTLKRLPLQPSLGGAVYYSPDFFGETGNAVYMAGNLDLSLPAGFSLGAQLGWQDVQDATDYVHWRLGVGYQYKALDLDLDLSYQDATSDCAGVSGSRALCDGTVIFTVSAAFDVL